MKNDLFEGWFKKTHPHSSLEKTEEGFYFRRKTSALWQAFEAGQQSRQAEVDDKFIANCKLTDHIHILQRERDELQKRIDEALTLLEGFHYPEEYEIDDIDKAIEILKGEENE